MFEQEKLAEVIDWSVEADISTPVLLLTSSAVRAAVARLRHELGGRISYATKANAHPLVLREMAGMVDEFNVTNVAHLDALLAAGVAPGRIAFVNPVTAAHTLRAVAQRRVTRFVADDLRGLAMIRDAVAEPRLTLRLLPPNIGQSSRSVVRFGNTHDALLEVATAATAARITIEALSFFVGTAGEGMAEAMPYKLGIDQLARLHEQLGQDGVTVPTVNIGGGFPGAGRRFFTDHPGFFRRIRQLIAEYFGSTMDFICEPGRFLSEPSMAMLATVIADRTIDGRRMVHLDASAFGGLFETCFIDHGGDALTIGVRDGHATATAAAVLGPVMDSFDVVKRHAELPRLTDSERVLIPNIGAYSWGYTAGCEGLRAPELIALPDRLDRLMT